MSRARAATGSNLRPAPPAAASPGASNAARVLSLDVLRALVVLLMIFINDLNEGGNLPGWLMHADPEADAMTIPDVVFAAFLFIVGVSIPLSVERALAGGRSGGRLLARIAGRTFALLVVGVLTEHMDEYENWGGWWGVLVFIAVFAALAVPPLAPGRLRVVARGLRIAGWVGLAVLALTYRTADGAHLVLGPLFDANDSVWLRHEWWGILGEIGWAYLVASLLYLALRARREWLLAATFLLMLLFVAGAEDFGGHFGDRSWLQWAGPLLDPLRALFGAINEWVDFGSTLGSQASIAMAGCCLGSILLPGAAMDAHRARLRWAGGLAAVLAFGALLLDPLYGINKDDGTPAWCWYSAALVIGAWMALYWIIDVRGWRAWARPLQPTGANPLLAYILHPFVLLVAEATAVPLTFYASAGWPLVARCAGSLVMAGAILALTTLLVRAGYRIKV